MRLGVVGVSPLATVRVDALLATGSVELVAVAARRQERAAAFAERYPGAQGGTVDDLFARDDLDAVLVALPHRVQDEVVLRCLDAGLDVLIGGPLASTLAAGQRVVDGQRAAGVVVEAGYEARYKSVWRRVAELLGENAVGELVSVRSNAGYEQQERGWHYEQEASGGMLVTHLTYAFLDPLRWLLGEPVIKGAIGNVKRVLDPGGVRPETVMVLAEFPGRVVAAMTASYVKPSDLDDWDLLLVGTDGALEIHPGDQDGGRLRLSRRGAEAAVETFPADGFLRQAAAFVGAVEERRGRTTSTAGPLLSPPADAVLDLALCAEIDAAWDDRGPES
ncbi:Gfo/Idh/MocA family protein [Microlunatus antarcticus]|uniref:Putative dehydrogenase n=1 Tax=Microlunatus antarcticus TaxID=53388 RepID=A0A7W5JX40_9ACTN|nr:putative dehydrogenase [Microlunatus antarcticus]